MKSSFALSLAALSTLASAAPVYTATTADPCALISSSYRSQLKQDPKSKPLFKPSSVLACLREVPINRTAAVDFVDYISKFASYQSTLAYLKTPPSDYPFPPVDVLGGLSEIQNKVKNNGYSNQFDFEYDIYMLGRNTYDGHTSIGVMLPTSFFVVNQAHFVSFSKDGTELPGVYFASDFTPGTTFAPSDVVTIDNVDVHKRLIERGSSLQDVDALYNSMFLNPFTAVSNAGDNYASHEFIYFEDSHVYKFRNGTERTIAVGAATSLDFSKISSGKDIYQLFLNPANNKEDTTPSTPSKPSQPAPPPSTASAAYMKKVGFPSPVAIALDNSIAGYFSETDPKLAVLSIFSFTGKAWSSQPDDFQPGQHFSDTVKEFLAKSKQAGKTKLIVDVRGNPGGKLYTGYDVFKQLYPALDAPTMGRLRAHKGADFMGKFFSEFGAATQESYETISRTVVENEQTYIDVAKFSEFNYNSYVKTDKSAFNSWDDFDGPVSDNGDTFSQYFSYDLNDLADMMGAGGFVVSGYANNTDIPDSPFHTNVAILTDGACSSTCGIFVNLMVNRGKARTIVIGGRPSTDRMAAIGGTQGMQVQKYSALQYKAKLAVRLWRSFGAKVFTQPKVLAEAANYFMDMADEAPINMNMAGSTVNLKDSYFGGDGSSTPLQFQKVKAGDCRMFYQRSDLTNVGSTWDRISTGKYTCVDGGNKW